MKTLALQIYVVLAILWGLVSCAPRAIVVDPMAPHVAKAHAEVKAAVAGAKRVREKVTAVHSQSQGIAAEADRMKAETDRLRNLPGVPMDEFDALWAMVTDHQRETSAHEIQAREAVAEAAESEKLNVAAEKSAADLEPLAKATDAGVAELKTQIVKQADDASLGRALKGVFWMGVISLGLIAILYLLIKLKPGLFGI